MIAVRIIVLSVLLSAVKLEETLSSTNKGRNITKFPAGFLFGAGTSAYQIEGGWNASDKSESIWDRFVHSKPSPIRNGETGDIAADSYNLWQEDIRIAAELGLHFYKFSLSWSRLLPKGYTYQKSENGKNYYNNLINGLLKAGIKPVVTIYHWDLPQCLQDIGGWTNPLIADIFAEYAEYVFSIFGDRVKTWITINEPIAVCDISYNTGTLAPGIKEPIFASYLCNKFILLAHAKAYRIYDKRYRPTQHGKVSLSNNLIWIEPKTPADEELAELARQHYVCNGFEQAGRYSYPIYSKNGGWPPSIEKLIGDYSREQGFNKSRLPPFTKEEIKIIKGSFDFYGMNYYTTALVRQASPEEKPFLWHFNGSLELNLVMETNPSWPTGASSSMKIYPEGLRRQIGWLIKEYSNIDILITENGYSNYGRLIRDTGRIQFIKDHLKQVLLSIWVDGANVLGYSYWSLMDSFEWTNGYRLKLGIYATIYIRPPYIRMARLSAKYYANVIRTNSIAEEITNFIDAEVNNSTDAEVSN